MPELIFWKDVEKKVLEHFDCIRLQENYKKHCFFKVSGYKGILWQMEGIICFGAFRVLWVKDLKRCNKAII